MTWLSWKLPTHPQSEQEKQLRKQFKKKENKLVKKELQVAYEDQATRLQALGFNPLDLRKERYNYLSLAMLACILYLKMATCS